MSKRLIEKIINDVSLDERVSNGVFSIEEDAHMDALRDYLSKKGITKEMVNEFSNKILEGKYPERQAYNAEGILVTFPTPRYKMDAIQRGTHFEEDPTKGQSNLFGGEHKPAPAAPTAETPKSTPPASDQPKTPTQQTPTQLPVSQAAPPASDATPADTTQATTTAAPQQTPSISPEMPDTTPVKEPTELPPPAPKSPAEKEANKDAIKIMLKGDDFMLEELVKFVMYNGPDYLIKEIKKKTTYE